MWSDKKAQSIKVLSDHNTNQQTTICFVLLEKSDPHHPESDKLWADPIIGPHCVSEDSLNGRYTDVIIRIDGIQGRSIRDAIDRMGFAKIATVYEVKTTLSGLYQMIPFSTSQRDIGYYFVKCGRIHKDLAQLFAEANKERNVNFSTHQLYLLKRGWMLAIMSGDRLHDFNDFMVTHFYNKTGRIIESSYLLGVLESRRTSKPELHVDVISNMQKVVDVTGGGVRAKILGILLRKDATFRELVNETEYSEGQVSRGLTKLMDAVVEQPWKGGPYTLHTEKLRPLYAYTRSKGS